MRAVLFVLMATGTAMAEPLPKLADVKTLELRQGQGGPASAHCNAIVYTFAIDVAKNAWKLTMCTPDPKDPDKVVVTKGALTAAQRGDLDADYAALDAVGDSKACGFDGGTLALTVTMKAGGTTHYIDLNWGCRKPVPVTVPKLKEFAGKLVTAALAKSP